MTSRIARQYRVLIISAPPLDKKGKIIQLPGGVADILVRRGMIEPIEEATPAVIETTCLNPEADYAVQVPPVTRKRGRPRKVQIE